MKGAGILREPRGATGWLSKETFGNVNYLPFILSGWVCVCVCISPGFLKGVCRSSLDGWSWFLFIRLFALGRFASLRPEYYVDNAQD